MKEIIKYVSEDGTEFKNGTDCVKYEELCNRVQKAMAILPDRPETSGFSNGVGYLRHNSVDFNLAKQSLLLIIAERLNLEWLKKEATLDPHLIHNNSIVGRYVCDSGNKALNKAWYRLMCTDDQYREWGQPYYAINPTKGKDVVIQRTS